MKKILSLLTLNLLLTFYSSHGLAQGVGTETDDDIQGVLVLSTLNGTPHDLFNEEMEFEILNHELYNVDLLSEMIESVLTNQNPNKVFFIDLKNHLNRDSREFSVDNEHLWKWNREQIMTFLEEYSPSYFHNNDLEDNELGLNILVLERVQRSTSEEDSTPIKVFRIPLETLFLPSIEDIPLYTPIGWK